MDPPLPAGGRLVRHDVCDSTNERALDALARGVARHGDAHVARVQTAGRGRRGRTWHGAAGEGLYLSLVWAPAGLPDPAALTIAAGLGVLDAAAALGVAGARLKWPNDLVVGGAKLAGVLVEARGGGGGGGGGARGAAVGVGLNVCQRGFPPELLAERPVTSLALLGLGASVDDALGALVPRLVDRLEAPHEPLERDYLAALGLAGRRVRATVGGEAVWGLLVGLTIAGGLVLDTGGAPRRVPLAHVGALEPFAPRAEAR